MFLINAAEAYKNTNFDPANIYLVASTALLSLCVYFLKRHVDGQDKLNAQVAQLLTKVEVIESNSQRTNKQVEHISDKVDQIQERLNEHDVELSVIRSKIPA